MYKNKFTRYHFLLLLYVLILSACDNKTEIEKVDRKIDQVEILYPWLEGDWQGELYFHAEDRSFPGELKYHNGELQVMFKEYCKGKVSFSSRVTDTDVFVQCNSGEIKITPLDSAEQYNLKIKDINEKIKGLRIEYNEEERFAGWLMKIEPK